MSYKKVYNYTLTVNSSNVVQNGNNNTFKYNFINGNLTIPDEAVISISSATVPYSFRNITSAYNNNKFIIYFPFLATYNTYNITLPDGFYNGASDINYYIQQFCITNGLYLVNASGQNVYYLSLQTNINYYAVQIIATLVPTSLPVGYTQPLNWIGYPTTTACPGLGVLNNFGSIIGYTAGNYPSTFIGTTNLSYLSNTVPNTTPVNSLTIRCDLCNNPVSFPSDIIDSFNINSTYGTNILYQPTFEKIVSLRAGTYSNFLIYLCDQNNNLINALDPNILITLRISYKK